MLVHITNKCKIETILKYTRKNSILLTYFEVFFRKFSYYYLKICSSKPCNMKNNSKIQKKLKILTLNNMTNWNIILGHTFFFSFNVI